MTASRDADLAAKNARSSSDPLGEKTSFAAMPPKVRMTGVRGPMQTIKRAKTDVCLLGSDGDPWLLLKTKTPAE